MDMPTPAPVPVDHSDTAREPDLMYQRPEAQTPAMPAISDYWPDAPHRLGPVADRAAEHTTRAMPGPARTPPLPGSPARPTRPAGGAAPRRRPRPLLWLALAMLLLVGIGTVGVKLVRHSPSRSSTAGSATAPLPTVPAEPLPVIPAPAQPSETPVPSTTTARAGKPAPPPPPVSTVKVAHAIAAPANGRTDATFELVSNATTVTVRTTDLGADLYRISTPTSNTVLPQVKAAAAGIRLFLVGDDHHRGATADVVLNSRVRWSLTITGGVSTGTLDLGDSAVDRVDLVGGAARMDLTLPPPNGTTEVRMSGGLNQFRIRTTDDVPIRVRTRQGAGKVVFNGETDTNVDKGETYATQGFGNRTDRIDVDAVAGIGVLVVGPA